MDGVRVVETLSRDECTVLLGLADIGRVILTAQALPTALPVHYVVDDGVIVFRISGAKLAAAPHGTVVAFEIDDFDADLRTGWSVVVTGVATAVTTPEEVRHMESLGIPTWVNYSTQYVRLSTDMISGRRVAPVAAPPHAVGA